MNSETAIKKGQLITSTTTEKQWPLLGPFENGTVQTVLIELVSGAVQFTVAARNSDPVIDNTYRVYSNAGDRLFLTVQTGMFELRSLGTGTFSATW